MLYPRAFRRSYREPMVQLFGDCVRTAGAKVWLRTIPDLVRTVPAQRIEAAMALLRVNTLARVVAIVLIVLGGVVVAMGSGGPVIVAAFALAAMAFLALGRGTLVPVFRGERAPLRHALVQAWWAPLAGLLGAAMIFFGVGTIFEAHNWGGRVVGSSILLAFGFGMLFGLARRPFARASGNALILITTIPAMLFFWVIVPTVVALVVWVGVLSSGFSDDSVTPASVI
jgi:hypothetical protein